MGQRALRSLPHLGFGFGFFFFVLFVHFLVWGGGGLYFQLFFWKV